jgi:hypothetical protein
MRIRNGHERAVPAPPERVAELIADFGRIWPSHIAPAPRRQEDGLYHAGLMLWEEVDRPGAVRAFRVAAPHEIQAEHWFEVAPADDGAVLRHVIDGRADGRYEAIWRDRIEPLHDRILEALLDNVAAAAT